jgi:hypothetical protein
MRLSSLRRVVSVPGKYQVNKVHQLIQRSEDELVSEILDYRLFVTMEEAVPEKVEPSTSW